VRFTGIESEDRLRGLVEEGTAHMETFDEEGNVTNINVTKMQ
jgi:hypothetical protein